MGMESDMTRKPVNSRLRYQVYQLHQGVCFYCGKSIDQSSFVVDHVTPVIEGGTDDLDNLVASCKFCNASKCALDIDSWKMKLSESVAVQIGKAIDRLNLMHEIYGIDDDEFRLMMRSMKRAYESAQKIDIKLFFERCDD